MPELRKDPLLPRWVVMAPERAKRPIQSLDQTVPASTLQAPHQPPSLQKSPGNRHRGLRSRSTYRHLVTSKLALSEPVSPQSMRTAFDPFAEGNEISTPPEVLAYRYPDSLPNGPGWRVRVVPNKFPALELQGNLDPAMNGLYETFNGLGVHEVIIECPHDETNIARLSADSIREVLSAYRERMLVLKQDPRLVHVIIFKNNGILAGASLPHSHSQLIASPVIPITITEEIEGARSFYDSQHRSIFDEIIQQERATGARIILETEHFIAVCPYASRFPYEVCLLPKRQQSHFESIEQEDLAELAQVLKTVLRKLEVGLSDPPYNYVIHTAPSNERELPWFRWHIEIFPRLTSVAGFEWGSGFYINPVFPEVAAEQLRSVVV